MFIQLRFLQGLVAIDVFDHFSNFFEGFLATNKGPNEIADQWHDIEQRG
jgi:hypothetical protein